jgi:hypothetical protein
MGLKFLCHHCNEPMHVKNFLAGKRGKCPNCNQSIRIPEEGEEFSRPVSRAEDVAGSSESSQEATEETAHAKNIVASKSVSVDSASSMGTKSQERDFRPVASKGQTTGATNASSPPPPPPGEITLPKCIEEAPNAAWYVRPPSGGQYGPAVGAVFWDWLKEKRVGESALVWREGWGTWQTASAVFPEFFQKSLSPPSPNPSQVPPAPDALPPAAAESLVTGIKADTTNKSIGKSSAAVRSKIAKKKNKSKRDIAIFIALSLLALILIGVLIWVLISQVK